jgi:hypothetical protein
MSSFVDAGVSDDVREKLAFAIFNAPISAEYIVGDSTGISISLHGQNDLVDGDTCQAAVKDL